MRILASKELRISGIRGSAGNADLEEEDGGAAAAIAAVKGRVVTQLMKKNLVQNAVPIFIELKRYQLKSAKRYLRGTKLEFLTFQQITASNVPAKENESHHDLWVWLLPKVLRTSIDLLNLCLGCDADCWKAGTVHC